MGVFSNVIPGLRDFRAPFASGVLWLLLGYLLFHDDLTKASAPELFDLVDDLPEVLTTFGTVAVISASAYLLGATLESLWRAPLQLLPQLSYGGLRTVHSVVKRELDALPHEELVCVSLCHPGLGGVVETPIVPVQASPEIRLQVERRLQAAVRAELDIIATRLMSAHNDLFQISDRLRAEAEFRAAIALPLTLTLFVVLSTLLGGIWAALTGVTVFTIFVFQAVNRRVAAGDRVADALELRIVTAPALEGITRGKYTADAFARQEITPASATAAEALRRSGVTRSERLLYRVIGTLGGLGRNALAGVGRWGAQHLHALGRAGRETAFVAGDLLTNRGRIVRRRRQLRSTTPDAVALRIELGRMYFDAGKLGFARREYTRVDVALVSLPLAQLELEERCRQLLPPVQPRNPQLAQLVATLRVCQALIEQNRLVEAERTLRAANDLAVGDVLQTLQAALTSKRALGRPQRTPAAA